MTSPLSNLNPNSNGGFNPLFKPAGTVSTGTGIPFIWRNGPTRAFKFGVPPAGWVKSEDGSWYPPSTWKNGITKKEEMGMVPTGWELQPDGFYYPPQVGFDPNEPIPLTNYLIFSPSIEDIIERNYIRGSLSQIDPVTLILTNISQDFSINVQFYSIPGVSFSPSQLLIEQGSSTPIVISFNQVEMEKLADGTQQIEIFFQLSSNQRTA
jgi:hypothetical protein